MSEKADSRLPLQGKRILLVEDDATFRMVVANLLSKLGADVVEAENGEEGQALFLGERSFDFVLSDIRMPKVNGLELLKSVKASEKAVPFLLMTGFAEISEAKDALELGAHGFLSKPFSKEVLLKEIEEARRRFEQPVAASSSQNLDLDFCSIDLDQMISTTIAPVDIYIRLGESYYMLVAKQGASVKIEELRRKGKKESDPKIYVKKIDFSQYEKFLMALTESAEKKGSLSAGKHQRLVAHTMEVVIKNVFIQGTDPRAFADVKEIVKQSLEVLCQEPLAGRVLSLLNESADEVYTHSVGVAVYSVLLGKRLKCSPLELGQLATAGLLHDVGVGSIEAASPKSVEDRDALLRAHPTVGLQVLTKISNMSPVVKEVVLQHHELCDGSGFPTGLSEADIHPLARVVSLVNRFCQLAIAQPAGEGKPLSEVWTTLRGVEAKKFDFRAMSELESLFSNSSSKAA